MSTPNFTLLVELNSLYKEIEQLHKDITSLQNDITSLEKQYTDEITHKKNKLESEMKQRLMLEAIRKEIEELRIQEDHLQQSLYQEIDKSLEEYFEKGHYSEFVEEVVEKVQQKKVAYTITAGKNTEKFVPKKEKVEKAGADELRIILPDITYYLDPQVVKAQLRTKLLYTKLPEVALKQLATAE